MHVATGEHGSLYGQQHLNKWQVVRLRGQTAAGIALVKLLLTLPVYFFTLLCGMSSHTVFMI